MFLICNNVWVRDKLSDTVVPEEKLWLLKTNDETYFKTSRFVPKKPICLSRPKHSTSSNRPRTTLEGSERKLYEL